MLERWLGNIYRNYKYRTWQKSGAPIPPPHSVKQLAVLEYGKKYGCENFIETGTFMGRMIYTAKNSFSNVYSIELNDRYFESAKINFRNDLNVHLVHGDSARVLPTIIGKLNGPTLYWLDAHYSGGMTAKGDLETPILQELDTIYEGSTDCSVVLIDDAQHFTGEKDYPSISELESFVKKRWPNALFENKENIVRIIINNS